MAKVDLNTYVRKKDGGFQYIIRYKDSNGKWKTAFSKQGFKSKPEATKAMAMKMDEAEKLAKGELKINRVTLKSFFDMYMDHIKLYMQPNTINRYENMYNHFEVLSDKELSKINSNDIQKCVDKMVSKGLKHTSIRIYYTTFQTVLNSAKEEYKLIGEVPTIKLKLDCEDTLKKALSKEEIKQVICDFKNENIDYNLVLLFALEAGLRIGEIMGLTYKDIDFKNRTINVDKQWKMIKGKYDFSKPKTKNGKRKVPLSNNLYNLCIALDKKKDDRLIENKSTVYIGRKMVEKLKKYNVTTHELRHTFCTQLLINGLDIGTTANLMGHTTDMTLKIYNHIQKEHIKKASDLINNIF